jgi:2-desacetyl-2-hydroxyethyl bacteriochlorophyllide A dehydrogenase
MKAVRLVQVGEPLQMQDVPIPPVGARDILVQIRAAGICHSDVHYRAGASPVGPLPQTLGHEIAGEVIEVGRQVTQVAVGDRVCLHYLVTCGDCSYCRRGNEHIAVPARNAVPLPEEVPFEHGAVLMCSSATSFHALRKGRLEPGQTVAVFGAGGLGMSAIQLAGVFGASAVYAVDIKDEKLELASRFGAIPVNAAGQDPVAEIRRLTGERGVDVALEVIGLKKTMEQAVQSLAVLGRAVMVGIADRAFEIDSYRELLGREAEIIGCSDHLFSELPLLTEFARQGRLDLSQVVTRSVPLEAHAINEAMDALESFGGEVRTVIVP